MPTIWRLSNFVVKIPPVWGSELDATIEGRKFANIFRVQNMLTMSWSLSVSLGSTTLWCLRRAFGTSQPRAVLKDRDFFFC